MTAIIYMLAGMSSRFGGRIKSLVEVGKNNETLLEVSLNQSLKAGFSDIIFIVSEKTKKQIEEKFGEEYKGIPIKYAIQSYDPNTRNKPWGTTDALCSAKEEIKSPFVICNGDDLYGEESFRILFEHLKNNDTCASAGYKLVNVMPKSGDVNRGIFQIKGDDVISLEEVFHIDKNNYKEKGLDDESLCSMNLFAMHPNTLDELSKILQDFKSKNKENRDIECLLPVEISKLIRENKIEMKMYKTKDMWIGVTNPGDENMVKEIVSKECN